MISGSGLEIVNWNKNKMVKCLRIAIGFVIGFILLVIAVKLWDQEDIILTIGRVVTLIMQELGTHCSFSLTLMDIEKLCSKKLMF